MKFKSVDDVNNYFNNWPHFTDNEKLDTIRNLRKIGNLSKSHVQSGTYKCPIHHFNLNKPCGLGHCAYHRISPESDNCMLKAVHESKDGRLSISEISKLLNVTMSRVNQLDMSASVKIRRSMIKERVENSMFPRYKYLVGHCVECEASIHSELGIGDVSDEDLLDSTVPLAKDLRTTVEGYAWCSIECKKKKPQWMFLLEYEFGLPIKRIFQVSTEIVSNSELVDEAYGLDRGTVRRHLV